MHHFKPKPRPSSALPVKYTPYDGAELRRNPGIPEERFRAYAPPAQPQQEPVAVAYFENITGRIAPPDDTHRRKFPMCYRPLVFGDTAPPASKPLTGQQEAKPERSTAHFFTAFARAIETAHGIKENT